MRGRHLGFMVATVILAACVGTSPAPTATPLGASATAAATFGPEAMLAARYRSFGPDFAAQPPVGEPMRIDGAILSHDRRTITVAFTGGAPPYSRTNFCSNDYVPWARTAGNVLQVAVVSVRHPDQATFPPNFGCTMEGHGYVYRIALPEPFLGSTVVDAASGPLFVPLPERMAELGSLPPGWFLVRINASEASQPEPRELSRGWASWSGASGDEGLYLGLIQTFGTPVDRPIEVPIATVSIHGQQVPVGRNGESGYIATWLWGSDGLTLSAWDPAMTLDDFVAMANAVTIP